MNTSEQVVGTPDLNAALAKAQGEFLPIKKTKTAEVMMKSGGKYSFDYADLQDVISATVPALSKNGLSITMPIYIDEKLGCVLKVILRHSSGQVIESFLPLALQHSRPQDLGSLISYYRRYLLTALLNIASEDDDGNLAQGNEVNINPKKTLGVPEKTESREDLFTGDFDSRQNLNRFLESEGMLTPTLTAEIAAKFVGKPKAAIKEYVLTKKAEKNAK